MTNLFIYSSTLNFLRRHSYIYPLYLFIRFLQWISLIHPVIYSSLVILVYFLFTCLLIPSYIQESRGFCTSSLVTIKCSANDATTSMVDQVSIGAKRDPVQRSIISMFIQQLFWPDRFHRVYIVWYSLRKILASDSEYSSFDSNWRHVIHPTVCDLWSFHACFVFETEYTCCSIHRLYT